MLTILSFLFVLSLLIIVHELGHFTVAKIFGIGVEQFSLGLPPKLIGKKIGETEYVLSAIPFGGYVKMVGQDDFSADEEETIGPKDYRGKPAAVRIGVLFAGSFMNLVTAMVIFFFLFLVEGIPETSTRVGAVTTGSVAEGLGIAGADSIVRVNGKTAKRMEDVLLPLYTEKRTALSVVDSAGKTREVVLNRRLGENEDFGVIPWSQAKVGSVLPGSPADKGGLEAGDEITGIDSTVISGWYDMNRIIRANPGNQLVFAVRRGGGLVKLPVTPGLESEVGADGKKVEFGRIGVMMQESSRKVGPRETFVQSFHQTWFFTKSTLDFFVKLVTGRMSPKLLGGPVMIAEMAGKSAKSGFSTLLGFTAFISVNLGVLNLLPLPVLDGGHIATILIETVIRRKLSTKAKMAIQQAGMIALMLFMFYVTFNDIMRIGPISHLFGGK
jgi:regulator of sigma E protease